MTYTELANTHRRYQQITYGNLGEPSTNDGRIW